MQIESLLYNYSLNSNEYTHLPSPPGQLILKHIQEQTCFLQALRQGNTEKKMEPCFNHRPNTRDKHTNQYMWVDVLGFSFRRLP